MKGPAKMADSRSYAMDLANCKSSPTESPTRARPSKSPLTSAAFSAIFETSLDRRLDRFESSARAVMRKRHEAFALQYVMPHTFLQRPIPKRPR